MAAVPIFIAMPRHARNQPTQEEARHHMRRRALAVACALAALVAPVGVGTASATAADGSVGINACTTKQYRVTDHAWIRDLPGGTVLGDAYRSDLFNATWNNGVWRGGNLYTPSGNWKNSGWILAGKLQYTGRCW